MTDIVRNLLIINVLVFLVNHVFQIIDIHTLAIFYVKSPYFQPYQVVTHMFTHGDSMHLIFNMVGLVSFGPIIESLLGMKRFFLLYIGAGLAAAVLTLIVQYVQLESGANINEIYQQNAVGASGAIFGILIAFAMKFPNKKISLIFPPVSMESKYFVLIFICIDLYFGLSGQDTGIGHFAHLGGALFGFLIMTYWNKFGGSNFKRR